jgi:hypothetical protein
VVNCDHISNDEEEDSMRRTFIVDTAKEKIIKTFSHDSGTCVLSPCADVIFGANIHDKLVIYRDDWILLGSIHDHHDLCRHIGIKDDIMLYDNADPSFDVDGMKMVLNVKMQKTFGAAYYEWNPRWTGRD